MSCSESAAAVGEPLPGTAARAAGWLCLERPGAWGRDVLDGHTLDPDLSAALAAASAAHGVRVQLIRHPGRTTPGPLTVLVAHSGGAGWAERLTVAELGPDLVPLVAAAARPTPPGSGEPVTEPIALVCTHAKRDVCCARFGRPVAAGLAAELGDAVWETSHTGGHRFAPVLIVLPTGATYGGVDAGSAREILAEAAAGRVHPDRLRGRSALPPPAQAAEVAVRRLLDDGGERPGPGMLAVAPDGTLVTHADGRTWRLAVERVEVPARPASCGAEALPALAWAARLRGDSLD